MKRLLTYLLLVGWVACTTILSGCTQMPTEKQSVTDLRPQISFTAGNEPIKAASVLIDGLDMGAVGSYLNGAAALRITAGTHQLTIVLGNQVLLQEKFYIGDGVSRSFTLQ